MKKISGRFIEAAKKDFRRAFANCFKDKDMLDSAVSWVEVVLMQSEECWDKALRESIEDLKRGKRAKD